MKKSREIFNKSNTNLLVISTIAGVAFIASVMPMIALSLTLPTIIILCVIALLSAVVGIFSMYYAIRNNINRLGNVLDINNLYAKKVDIKFSQGDIINVTSNYKYPLTAKIQKEFDGLCDILCNYVTEHDLLLDIGSSQELTEKSRYENILSELEAHTVHSHILKTSSLIEKILAFLFGIYPCNILTYPNQLKIINYNSSSGSYCIKKEILEKDINSIGSGNYIKFCTFKRTPTQFHGHSMLIRKNGNDDFTFFDPNDGIRFNLTLNELVAVLNNKMFDHKKMWSHNDVAFIDNTKFLKKIQSYPSQELTPTNVNIAKDGIKVNCSV
uniref:Peptidase C58 YopT-type domain-containing protein n=1 Tax=Wolbachia endosymbiont of Aleurodicus dispersus TaxID=1288877 RepID=A0A3B0IZ99_9RICK